MSVAVVSNGTYTRKTGTHTWHMAHVHAHTHEHAHARAYAHSPLTNKQTNKQNLFRVKNYIIFFDLFPSISKPSAAHDGQWDEARKIYDQIPDRSAV